MIQYASARFILNNFLQIGMTQTIRLADFIINKVAKRTIPKIDTEKSPAVVMKVDIEGSELEVLMDFLISGASQYVDKVLVEFHPYFKVI